MGLFAEEIDGWQSWSRIFCNTQLFAPLVKKILARHGLPQVRIENLLPGTNAVFRAGDYVVKIYAPKESGLYDPTDGLGEYQATKCADKLGISVCLPVARGVLWDKYTFAYLITRYITGYALAEVLPQWSSARKTEQGKALFALSNQLHKADVSLCPACQVDLLERTCNNPRWANIPQSLAQQFKQRAKSVLLRRQSLCLVHGDMTGENILLLLPDRFALLDFGDAVIAPEFYEWPSLFLDGMQADSEVIRGFTGGIDVEFWIEQLLDGLCLHDFAANLIVDFAKRKKIDLESLTTIELLSYAFMQYLFI